MLRTNGDQNGSTPLLRSSPPARLAMVAHDLRQPASAALIIAGFIDELLEAEASGDVVREQTAAIRRCMRQALRLADDLAAAGRADLWGVRPRCACAPVSCPALRPEANDAA